MTLDNDQSTHGWHVALLTTLGDAIEHLQVLIFEDGWAALRVESGSDEAALRESVARYERELARLFSVLRVSGALPDAVAWSTLKTDYRRTALEAGTEISLRTALESGFYAAEPVPLGDHATYLDWSAALRGFLTERAVSSVDRPPSAASEDDRLLWAYRMLADLEDHDAFNAAFIEWLGTESADPSNRADIVALQARLLALPRFDLFLNTSLRWLAALPCP